MNVLTIIDSFKGTISSKRLGEIAKEELEKKNHHVDIIPVADGGDGFCEAIEDVFKVHHTKYKEEKMAVHDPLGRLIDSSYLVDLNTNTAYIELARASGISLLSIDELNPFITSTYGFGELISGAIKKGYKRIVLGIGGSATNDAGSGLLEALGLLFLDKEKKIITNLNNEKLSLVESVDRTNLEEKTKDIEFIVLSDVTNPLLGKSGATYVFSPQKGAKKADLKDLESNISYFARLNNEYINKAGSGAAGGVGYALQAYLNAKIYSGIDYILDMVDYDNLVNNYDVVITGEGKIDRQSLDGKVVFQVIKRSKNKKIILVCGINELDDNDLTKYNVDSIYSVVSGDVSVNDSMSRPEYYYRKMVESIKI